MVFGVETVIKIGSMALIDVRQNDIDYSVFARVAKSLTPGTVLVSSGAVEIGRIDYLKRNGAEITADEAETDKADYAAQGQALLMKIWRDHVAAEFGLRQVLVEHQHFNNEQKRAHIRGMLLRASRQNAVPIVNYNDAVSLEEVRKMEIRSLRKSDAHVVELVDNDETAGQIACLLSTKNLVILTSADGIYSDPADSSTLIREITGKSADEVITKISACQEHCRGASRAGAGGAWTKLEYIKEPVCRGTTVYIASAKTDVCDILSGNAKSTKITINNY